MCWTHCKCDEGRSDPKEVFFLGKASLGVCKFQRSQKAPCSTWFPYGNVRLTSIYPIQIPFPSKVIACQRQQIYQENETHTKERVILIIWGFYIWEFAYGLKFICSPQINMCDAEMVICWQGHTLGGERRSPPRLMFSVEVERSDTLPLVSALTLQQSKNPFCSSFSAFFFFCIFWFLLILLLRWPPNSAKVPFIVL